MEDAHSHNANCQTKFAKGTQNTVMMRQSKENTMADKDTIEMQPLMTTESAGTIKDSSATEDTDASHRHNGVPIDRGWAWMVLLGME